MISVSNLSKTYGKTLAVDRISFEVPKGLIVGFLGPNGAGKSTTLKMLTCYIPPTSGGATVAGFDIFHQADDVRKNLGYLPENVPLYPEMKVREYLEYRGQLRRLPRDVRKKRMAHVMERCWLNSVASKSIGHLSKGYRQRVGLADALLHNPPVLILDEPTVGLDPTQIRETRKLIKELGGDHTVVLSTHILPEVEAVCDRAIIIASGRIVAQGSPEQLRQTRRNEGRVMVECRGPSKEVRDVLARVAGVSEAHIMPDGKEDHYVAVSLKARDGYDVREEAARTVVQHGWPLREVRLVGTSLEEFFIHATASQAAAAVDANAAEAK